jgi:hypothetical protein
MEHRRGHRKTVRLAVKLATRHSSGLQGEIMDLSAGGAFIRLPKATSALRNMVHLRFCTHGSEPDCDCWALIVRTAANGIGVMFRRRQEQTFRQLETSEIADIRAVKPDQEPVAASN